MKNLKLLALAVGLGFALSAQAQTIPADSSGPGGRTIMSKQSTQKLASNICSADNRNCFNDKNPPASSTGATPLGTIVGTGSWKNTGTVALIVTVGANDQCYSYNVTTPDGYIVLKDDCEWSSSSTAFVVPGGGSFSITGGGRSTWNGGLRSNITALGERVTWASTGINGLVATPVTKVVSSYSDGSCNVYQVRDTTGTYTITGLTTTRESILASPGPCAPPPPPCWDC